MLPKVKTKFSPSIEVAFCRDRSTSRPLGLPVANVLREGSRAIRQWRWEMHHSLRLSLLPILSCIHVLCDRSSMFSSIHLLSPHLCPLLSYTLQQYPTQNDFADYGFGTWNCAGEMFPIGGNGWNKAKNCVIGCVNCMMGHAGAGRHWDQCD